MGRYGKIPLLVLAATAAAFGVWRSAGGTAENPDGRPEGRGGLLTVRDFGARGDGQGDQWAAIQQMVDQHGGEIRFPRGTYRITRPITVDLDRAGVTSIVADGTATLLMCGPGPALRIVGTHAGTADPATVKPDVWLRQRTPMIDGLEIVGGHPEAVGVVIEGTMQATLTRVTVRQALHGVVLTRRNRNVIISDCHLYDNRGAGLLLEHLNLHQINVTNCHISYNAAGGIVIRDSEIRNLQVGSCDIEANMQTGGEPTANILIDTSSGSVREGAIVGCTLQHSRLPGSANVRFLGRSRQEPQKVGHFAVSSNVLSDVDVNVDLKYARDVVVSGNTFFMGHAHNLVAEGCSNLVVSSNLFDRNPDYPPGSHDDLLFADCADATLSALHVNATAASGAAVTLRGCRRCNLTGCTILDCDGCGLLLDDVGSVRVSGCLVRDDRRPGQPALALRLTRGRGNMIVENLLGGGWEIPAGSAEVAGNVR